MTHKTTYLKPKTHTVSDAGRARMSEVGRANLQKYWAEKKDGVVPEQAQVIDKFRVDLLNQLGPSPSANRIALAESVVATYGAIVLLNKELRTKVRNSKRGDTLDLAERASWLSGTMCRLLTRLGLDKEPAKKRPVTLADIVTRSETGNGQIPAPEPTKEGV